MNWYINAFEKNRSDKSFSREDLIELLKKEQSDLSDNSYNWAIGSSVKDGLLVRDGYNMYSYAGQKKLVEYEPYYSDNALVLIDRVRNRFPHVKFTLFETVLMNDFLNHLIAQNTFFIQVEKESGDFVFRYIQEYYHNVMYKPNIKELELYWAKDTIIVTDLITEAPLRKNESHKITLEKMLVDMIADKLIAMTFSKAELPDVFKLANQQYRLDKVRMLRYARRRNKEEEVRKFLEGETE